MTPNEYANLLRRTETLKAELVNPKDVRPMAQIVKEMRGLQSLPHIPPGTSDQWYEAIYALVKDGYLEMTHGTHVNRKPIELPPEPEPVVEEEKPVQGMLF